MALNSISTLSTKEAKQVAKLDIAQAKRQGRTVAGDGTISGPEDSTQPYYRTLNEYDLTELPIRYSGNDIVSNQNSEGLLQSRPWSAEGITLPGVTMWLDPAYAISGVTVPDQSGNNNTGTLVNGTAHDADNHYFTFDGTDDYIRSTNLISDIGTPDSFSAGAWVRPSAGGVVVTMTNSTTPDVAYHFSVMEFVEAGGNPVPHFGIWNSSIVSDSGTALSYNTWYHMVITYDGTTMKGYINGSEVATATTAFASPVDDAETNQYLLWGATETTNMGDGTYYNGRMGEIRVYSGALTAANVLANYNATKSRYV